MRYLIFFCLMLCAAGVQAQGNFFEEGKYWTYRVYAPSLPDKEESFFKIYVDGDTIINDTLAVKLSSDRFGSEQIHCFAYEDGGRIFAYTEIVEHFVPIVDFNVSVGDTLTAHSVDMAYDVRCKVTEKWSVDLESETRSVFTIEDLSGMNQSGYWIEGVGATDALSWLTRFPLPACIYVTEMVECGVGDKRIYSKENFDAYAGISVVGAVGETDATIYDLAGRQVLNPRKGCVYIRGGKKIVW